MTIGKPLIATVLSRRMKAGKEDPTRIGERQGTPSRVRPAGTLLWVHVASVGEALSMLPVINLFLMKNPDSHVMITSVTRTAATLLDQRLPDRAFHQYLPVDRPKWVRRFLDHWNPDIVLWAESELWPFMMGELGKRRLPVALLNARMSEKSFRNWSRAPALAQKILSAFTVILTQTEKDREYFMALGGRSIVVSDNIKYCAKPLPCDKSEFERLKHAIGTRPTWIYASTHKGEEELALTVHKTLSAKFPDLLTIVAPRHPERSNEIGQFYKAQKINIARRGHDCRPDKDTEIFLVDTLGELGLFYRLASIACIGRSFSDDGGGGHNPIEPALLGCAVLHGPSVQNLQEIYDQMDKNGAALQIDQKNDLAPTLEKLLSCPEEQESLQQAAQTFAEAKSHILDHVVEELEPLFLLANLPVLTTGKEDRKA